MCDYVRSMQVVLAEVKRKLTGVETAQYSYYYYVFLLRLFLSLNYSRDKQNQKPKKKHNLSFSMHLCFYLFLFSSLGKSGHYISLYLIHSWFQGIRHFIQAPDLKWYYDQDFAFLFLFIFGKSRRAEYLPCQVLFENSNGESYYFDLVSWSSPSAIARFKKDRTYQK